MELVDPFVTEINKISPLREYILAHDKGTIDRVKMFCANLMPKLRRHGSRGKLYEANISKTNHADPVKEIIASLIDNNKTKDENTEFILEFIRVRLFRIYNEIREWRYFYCISDPQVNVLVGLLSSHYNIDRVSIRQFLYTIKILELIKCPLLETRQSSVPPVPPVPSEIKENLLKFFQPKSADLLLVYLTSFVETEKFPLFIRIALIQDLEGLTEFAKDFYSVATLHIPFK